MSEPAPEAPVLAEECWPVEHGCCAAWEEYPTEIQARADAQAVQTLRALTGYRVGGCPVTLRPCRADPGRSRWSTWWGRGPYGSLGGPPTVGPALVNGRWLNIDCGHPEHDCSCTEVCEIRVPTPWVVGVTIDGETLPAQAWRVDSPRWLVRIDGGCWPLCQDLTKADDQPGTWTVTYLPGAPVDGLAAYAAGVLACEYAKACSGDRSCRLPSGVTTLSRGGITMTMATELFPNNRTGIREVDAWLSAILAPRPRAPRVLSPDTAAGRRGRIKAAAPGWTPPGPGPGPGFDFGGACET